MFRASRYRLYPNPTQERRFVQLCGAARFVHNELLAEQIRNYQRFEARTAVVYRESNQWYVSVLWEVADADWQWRGRVCAVDRNTGNFALAWEGQTKIIPIPHERIESYEAKVRHYQWRASHRKLFDVKNADGEPIFTKSGKQVRVASNRRRKMQQRAAEAKRKAAGVRKDFSHQASAYLAQNFGHIVLEDLNVQGMRKSARGTLENPRKSVKAKSALNRKLSQTSCMGMLDRFLYYKAGDVIKVPAWNTSRTCAECGHTEKDNRRTQAHFRCLACGHTDNADANAARNIYGSSPPCKSEAEVEVDRLLTYIRPLGGSILPPGPRWVPYAPSLSSCRPRRPMLRSGFRNVGPTCSAMTPLLSRNRSAASDRWDTEGSLTP